ncbi:MAG: phage protein Gp27 family protein [Nitratireductor sp.]
MAANRARTKRPPRQGRGKLHTIDMLPDECDADITWLSAELREGKRLQIDLLAEFNARLADRGIGSISKSSFSRYTVRKAMAFRELDRYQRLSTELAGVMKANSSEATTVALSELGKVRAFELLEEGGLNSTDILNLQRSNREASGATKLALAERREREKEFREKVNAAAKDIKAIGEAGGVSQETLDKITRRLTGMV